jgi:hypothetical protein
MVEGGHRINPFLAVDAASPSRDRRGSMPLRADLLLRPPTQEHVDRIRKAATDILSGLDRGEDVGERIRSLTALTGREYDLGYFESLDSHSSIDEFAREAALPVARVVPDITRDELIDIVRLAMTLKWPDDQYYRDLFDKNVPMSGASSLIDYPEDWKPGQCLSKYNPTPEDIVDKATAPGRIIYL